MPCSDAYVGSLISLTSKSEIRYEGVLFTLDTEKSTIVLKDVRSFGTEGRGQNILQIPSSSKVYEYIIFRNTDIKDLSVVSFSRNSDMPIEVAQEGTIPQDNAQKELSGHCMDVCLGWPVSPRLQEGTSWWPWFCSSAASGSYGILSNGLLAAFPNIECKAAPVSSWSSFTQENHDAPAMMSQAKFLTLEQVPILIPGAPSFAATQHHVPSSRRGFSTVHESSRPKILPRNNDSHFGASQVRPLWKQPLLPLPVSESEHKRLIRESKGSANPEHVRRPKVSSRGRQKGGFSERGSSSSTCDEASSLIPDVSKDFDFEAMNEHFNKKELWNHIQLNELCIDEKQEDSPQTIVDTSTASCGLSRKALFVDDFFDLSLSEHKVSKEKSPKASNSVKQREIDLETFGLSSLPRKGDRKVMHRGAFRSGQHISIRTK